VIVEGALRNPGSLSDFLHATAVETAAVERLNAGIEQSLAHIGFRHAHDMTSRLRRVKGLFANSRACRRSGITPGSAGDKGSNSRVDLFVGINEDLARKRCRPCGPAR
jgi:hypothetical protein